MERKTKKRIMFDIVLAVLLLSVGVHFVWSAASVTQSMVTYGNHQERAVLTFDCQGSVTNGAIPSTTVDTTYLNFLRNNSYCLWMVEAAPGGTGPTANSDIYLKNANETDILGGSGVNKLDNATPSLFAPSISTTYTLSPMIEDFALSVSNQSVTNAVYDIDLIFTKWPKN